MCRCVRPIHWTRSPASEAASNSSHLKRGVQARVRPLWCHACLRLGFTIISGSWKNATEAGFRAQTSPIKLLKKKNNTGNFRAVLVYWNENGACWIENSSFQTSALRRPCSGIKSVTSSTFFSMKLFIFDTSYTTGYKRKRQNEAATTINSVIEPLYLLLEEWWQYSFQASSPACFTPFSWQQWTLDKHSPRNLFSPLSTASSPPFILCQMCAR